MIDFCLSMPICSSYVFILSSILVILFVLLFVCPDWLFFLKQGGTLRKVFTVDRSHSYIPNGPRLN